MGGNGSHSPCASCKLLRRRCARDCIFAPYFPSDDPHKFAIVHKVFGASNVSKMLQEVRVEQRADAVSSMVYEANARGRDPVYGCVGAISYLQNQVAQLQMQLAVAQAEILCIQMQQQDQQYPSSTSSFDTTPLAQLHLDPPIHHDKSFHFLQNNQLHAQFLNLTSNSNTTAANVISDSYKIRESAIYRHDMVS